MRRGRGLRIAVLLAGALLLVGLLCANLLAACNSRGLGAADDSFITFRMARNLGDGYGLVFNRQGPPVEAASNFLLTVMLGGAQLLGLSLIRTSIISGMVAAGLTVLLLWGCLRRRLGPWALLPAAALALMSLLVGNATSGLETTHFTLLLLAAVALYIRAEDGPRPRPRLLFASSLVFALVSMMRPEGPMYMLALGLPRLWRLLHSWRSRRALELRTELWWVAGFALLFVPYTLWRVLYFGDLLPNTFHAKEIQFIEYGKLESGVMYLTVMMRQEILLPVGLCLGLLSQLLLPRRRMGILLTVVLAQVLFMMLSGGDWPHMFGFGRFLLPAVPLLLWITAEAVRTLVKLRRPLMATALVLGLAGASQVDLLALTHVDLPSHYHVQPRAELSRRALWRTFIRQPEALGEAELWRRATLVLDVARYHNNFDAVVGLWLKHRYGRQTSIAAIQAGQFAYWNEMPFLDMFGLVSSEVSRLGRYEPRKLAGALRRFSPKLIALYKWNTGVHHSSLFLTDFLAREGYGLRYVFIRGQFRSFVVFEKGYRSSDDPVEILFAPMEDLPYRVSRNRLIAALDTYTPTL